MVWATNAKWDNLKMNRKWEWHWVVLTKYHEQTQTNSNSNTNIKSLQLPANNQRANQNFFNDFSRVQFFFSTTNVDRYYPTTTLIHDNIKWMRSSVDNALWSATTIQPNSHSPVKLHKWYYSANFLVFDWSINATNFNFSIRFSTTGICIFHSFRRIWWIMAYAINQNLH